MSTEIPEAPILEVSKEELEEAQKTPAIYSNKFYISISTGGVRITFAESHASLDTPTARTAVMLPFGDAFALKDLLGKLLADNVRVANKEDLDKAVSATAEEAE